MSPSDRDESAEASRWARWHDAYEDPDSDLSRRLRVVQTHVRRAIEGMSGRVRLISVCAGQGHDVIGSLVGHARAADVRAMLVEMDDHNVEVARRRAVEAGLMGVEVLRADASLSSVYRDAVPADILLLCGIFGNVSNDDVRTTVANASRLCAPRAVVVWTRHRSPPDVTPAIRGWFCEAGFDEVVFDSPGQDRFAVGTHRLADEPLAFVEDLRFFTFRS
ncbi:MAG: SAM-dependent methyltransferase [Actinomycetota bacterium]